MFTVSSIAHSIPGKAAAGFVAVAPTRLRPRFPVDAAEPTRHEIKETAYLARGKPAMDPRGKETDRFPTTFLPPYAELRARAIQTRLPQWST
jgi:hypothetical protein